MSRPTRAKAVPNVNVTFLEAAFGEQPLAGKFFPCPTCGMALPVKLSRREKPYCVCNDCGNQLFFRGRKGIERLAELIRSKALVSAEGGPGTPASVLYNRLLQLRKELKGLKKRRDLILTDHDLENAIHAVANEMEHVQDGLRQAAMKAPGERKS